LVFSRPRAGRPVADHHELAAAFDHVEAAPLHFCQHPLATDLTLDPGDRAADHPAFSHRFRREDLGDPQVGYGMLRQGLHAGILPQSG